MQSSYCPSPYRYTRRVTREVMVGNVGVGGSNPIRIQSMLTSDTRDTDACVKEALELAEAGCEIIRLTAQTKAFIDRCGYVSGANGGLLRHKVGAPVVAVRRAGGNIVYAAINFFFGIAEMPIATSTYWNMTLSLAPGDVLNDGEGVRTFHNLGKNMAWMVQSLGRDNA